MDRPLDSQFRGTTDPSKIVFEESRDNDSADTRLASRRVIEAVNRLHQERAANQEARFAGPLDPDVIEFNGWSFHHRVSDNMFWTVLSDKTEIGVSPYIFKEDAKQMLSVLYTHQEALKQAGPLKVRIGVRRLKSTSLGGCTISSGHISFFSDEDDGVYATGLATVTKPDEHPIILERAILHELAHVMERNPEVEGALALLRLELETMTKEAVESPGKKPDDLITPELWEAAAAINPEYLPRRMQDSITLARHEFGRTSSMDDAMIQADLMASDFWAEAFAARVWDKNPPELSENAPPGLFLLCKYIDTYGEKLLPGAPFEKEKGEIKERRRSLLFDLDERIEYFGSRGSLQLER
jgi:hypothetical protein